MRVSLTEVFSVAVVLEELESALGVCEASVGGTAGNAGSFDAGEELVAALGQVDPGLVHGAHAGVGIDDGGVAGSLKGGTEELGVKGCIVRDEDIPVEEVRQLLDDVLEGGGVGKVGIGQPVYEGCVDGPERIDSRRVMLNGLGVVVCDDDANVDNAVADGIQSRCLDIYYRIHAPDCAPTFPCGPTMDLVEIGPEANLRGQWEENSGEYGSILT